MFTIYLKLKRLKNAKKQKRKCWVRPIFRLERRRLQGASDNLVREMQLNDPDKYFNYFRMSSETFRRLLALVGPLITKQEYIREPIPPRTRLEVTLRYLASRDSMTSISYAFRIGHNISKIIAETCEVIWTTLKEEVFLQPNETNWQTINEDFDKHWNFPHCIGAINGKHIVANSGSCFYNYKGNHSINKENFNYRLSRARRVVESAFGILAVGWRIFHRSIIACTSTVQKIVQAAIVLLLLRKNICHCEKDAMKFLVLQIMR
ncbi:hypothetical protein ALC57_02648 [Trachymyrmex cornetzi]|uniref:DDE Tnp4 domain-containing protein n=1 Tax=Trachymyrmex cornetzi TaxID=471704 RepID=A0A151JNB7_9HYME|nr:hypothetical protein ALC57_02648 [Trachymyrmex cornetzi]